MSYTLEHTASRTPSGQSLFAGKRGATIGASLSKCLAFGHDLLADVTAHEIIEGGALMAVLAATAVFILGAFGAQIGAN